MPCEDYESEKQRKLCFATKGWKEKPRGDKMKRYNEELSDKEWEKRFERKLIDLGFYSHEMPLQFDREKDLEKSPEDAAKEMVDLFKGMKRSNSRRKLLRHNKFNSLYRRNAMNKHRYNNLSNHEWKEKFEKKLMALGHKIEEIPFPFSGEYENTSYSPDEAAYEASDLIKQTKANSRRKNKLHSLSRLNDISQKVYMDKRKNAWKNKEKKEDNKATNQAVDRLFGSFGKFLR